MKDADDKEMSFFDHLEALRWHLLRGFAVIIVFATVAFIYSDFVFHELILGPTRTDFWFYKQLCKLGELTGTPGLCFESFNFKLQSRSLTGQFSMHLVASVVVGLVLGFPYLFWEVWRFIKPGLYPTEQRITTGTVIFVSFQFITGVLFGYFIVTPLSVNFLANYVVDPAIENNFDITNYVSLLVTLVLACGLMFQLPVAAFFLAKIGLITPAFLRAYRRHAIVIVLIIGAVLTPPDVVSQVLVSLPVVILYEVSIWITAVVQRNKAVVEKNEEEE